MTYRWVEHTAELELAIEAPREEDVFAEAVAAFAELLGDGQGPPARHSLSVAGTDRAGQLADWLDELVYLAETEDFVPDHLAYVELSHDGAEGVVEGHRGSPPHLVKAVTYHGLRFEPTAEGWKARVVLDV